MHLYAFHAIALAKPIAGCEAVREKLTLHPFAKRRLMV